MIQKGHTFYTHSDTEVIIHLYEEEGVNCLQKLNGQFAFAIWDNKKNNLFIARDRVGTRPLFFAVHDNQFIFSSEAKAILSYPGFPRKINLNALDQVFTFWTTLKGSSIFDGISELPPGNYLLSKDGRIEINKFWQLPFSSQKVFHHREKLVDNVRELIYDAVKIRLRADLPVGTVALPVNPGAPCCFIPSP